MITVNKDIAVIKLKNRRSLVANYARLERLKKHASKKAVKILSNAQRQIRKANEYKSTKLNFEDNLKFWNLVNTSSEDLKIMCFENNASISNGKELLDGNRILND